MRTAPLWMLALSVVWLAAPAAHAEPKPQNGAAPAQRKLVIAPFGGEAGQRARAIVLELVAGRSDRTDYTVIGHDDVEVVAKRIGASPASNAGKKAIADELGIDFWLTGELDSDGRGELRLLAGHGATLTRLPLAERSESAAALALRDRVWPWVGARLSEQERIARRLDAERGRALDKVEARRKEIARQVQLVREREARRAERLAAARTLARKKAIARDEELARQIEIVRERREAIAREEQRRQEEAARALAAEAERQRREEEAAMRAAAQAQAAAQAAAQAPAPQPAATWQPPKTQWQAAKPAQSEWPAATDAQWQQPAQPQPHPAAAWQQPVAQPRPVAPPRGQWSQWQQPAAAPAAAPAPAPAPAVQPYPVAEPAAPVVPELDGISPETRAWLEQKRRERAQQSGAY